MDEDMKPVTVQARTPSSTEGILSEDITDDLTDGKIRFKEDFLLMVQLLQGALKLPPNSSPASIVCELQLKFRHYDETIKDYAEKAQNYVALRDAVREVTNTSRDRTVDDLIDRLEVMWRRQEKVKVYMRKRLDNAEEQLRCSRTLVQKLESKLKNTGEKESQLISHIEKMQEEISSVSEEGLGHQSGDVSDSALFRKQNMELKKKCERLEKDLARIRERRPMNLEKRWTDYEDWDDWAAEVAITPSGEKRSRTHKNGAARKNTERGTQTDTKLSEHESERGIEHFQYRNKEELACLRFENDENREMVDRLRTILSSFHRNVVVNTCHIQISPVSTIDQAVLALFATTQVKRLDPPDLAAWGASGEEVVLGKGAFGKVLLMRYIPTSLPVAVKVQERKDHGSRLTDEQLKSKLISRSMKEAIIHHVMSDNPSFPAMHGVVELGDRLGMVLEFIGDSRLNMFPLCDVMAEKRPELTRLEWIDIALDVVNGLAALHEKGLLHNDLKKNNILLQRSADRWRSYIIDFGHASAIIMPLQLPAFSLQEEREYDDGLLYQHLAPEVVRDQHPTSAKTDVYSLGVVLLDIARVSRDRDIGILAEMCTRSKPYRRPTMPNVELSILRAKQKAQIQRRKESA